MSVGPLGNINALSGTSQEVANLARRAASEQRAEQALGFGEVDADEGTTDRDADGRRPWEFPRQKAEGESTEPAGEQESSGAPHQSKDATGNSGVVLDLLG